MTDIKYLKTALNKKLQLNYSEKYKSRFRFTYRCLAKENTTPKISSKDIKNNYIGIAVVYHITQLKGI
jgi:hypothetical protein